MSIGDLRFLYDGLKLDNARLTAENAKLRTELKNFLAAFDEYFNNSWDTALPYSKAMDAKQAMFSAAMSARKVLE